MTTTIVLVGCGSSKADSARPARRLYTSSYFARKRRLAELLGDRWRILSAEHHVIDPDELIQPYETDLEDVENLTAWRNRVSAQLNEIPGLLEDVELVVLAGKEYSRHALQATPATWDRRRPFDDVDGALPGQMRWMADRIDELTVDEDAPEHRDPRFLYCWRCNRPQYHEIVDPETIDGLAWQCSHCSILTESGQMTIEGALEAGGRS